jgi:flagellar biosynthesis anti-sigma factor FlgM
MRIDDLNRTPLTQGTEKADPNAQKRAVGKDHASPGAPDRAEVSELAQSLAAHDPDRIEQLRLEVQSGKYEVSAEAVAKAIIAAHLKE